MKAPLYPLGVVGDEAAFLINFFIGLAFGFFLERAGFGSARKLTDVFYFRDWGVLRVMFTAIVVAMIGLLYFSGIGWLDMEAMNVLPTYLGAQIVGGLLLGAGFIVGGYCPGTSAVAAASGKVDSLFYVAGLFFGTFVFGEGFDYFRPLYNWGSMGVRTVPEWLGVSPGVVAAGVVLIALAAFFATEMPWRKLQMDGGLHVRVTFERLGAAALSVLAFGLLVGYAMSSNAVPVQAARQPAPAAPAALPATMPGGAPVSAPAQVMPPGGVKKFKKGASCS